jgi:hypothetical protein
VTTHLGYDVLTDFQSSGRRGEADSYGSSGRTGGVTGGDSYGSTDRGDDSIGVRLPSIPAHLSRTDGGLVISSNRR